MENGTLVAGHAFGSDRSLRLRVSAAVAALALVFAMFTLVQGRAEASPAGPAAAAAVAVSTVGGAAQIDFGQIFCSILVTIRNAFANSPFFSFIVAAIDPLLDDFGCVPSPG